MLNTKKKKNKHFQIEVHSALWTKCQKSSPILSYIFHNLYNRELGFKKTPIKHKYAVVIRYDILRLIQYSDQVPCVIVFIAQLKIKANYILIHDVHVWWLLFSFVLLFSIRMVDLLFGN